MNIYEKLAAVQQELKAPKDKKNNFAGYSYRSAEGILEAVKPVLAKYKATIVLDDDVVEKDGRYYIEARAVFIDIEQGRDERRTIEVRAYAREAEEKKGLDVSQVTGTASSYARKYALNGLLLIDDTKDPDTEEYQKTTADNTPEKPSKTPEKRLSDAKKQIIRELAKKANIDLEDTGEDIETMSERRGDAMITALKLKLKGQNNDSQS